MAKTKIQSAITFSPEIPLSHHNSSLFESEKNQDIENFLAWLEHEEGVAPWSKEKISLQYQPKYGYYFRTKQLIPANERLFQLSYSLCITKDSVYAHAILGQHLKNIKNTSLLTNEIMTSEDYNRCIIYAFLMYEKYNEDSSIWSAYIKILPSLEELESRIPTIMDSSYYCPCLSGSTLEEFTIPTHQNSLSKFYQNLIFPLFSQLFTPDTVSTSFSFQHFKWATAIFLSRAILIPDAHGQTSEALCPLLDLMNHRPGTLSNLRIEGKLGQQHIFYSVGRNLKENEEICLNYGARSNGDLLGYFGFTLPDNIADVFLLNLPCYSTSLSDHNYIQSFILFIHCDIPSNLLEFIRQKLYFEDLSVVDTSLSLPCVGLEFVYDIPSNSLSSSDWLNFEDNQLSPINFDSIGSIISLKNEFLTLEWLKNYFLNKTSQLMVTMHRNEEELKFVSTQDIPIAFNTRSQFLLDCQIYLQGQIKILEYLCNKIHQMINSLQKGSVV